jgi:hypothetical protein
MIAEPDVVRRLHSAAEAISVEVPEAKRAISAGRRRGASRWAGLVAAVAVVAAGTAAAVSLLSGLHRMAPAPAATFDPSRTRAVSVPYTDSPVPVPNGWASTTATGEHVWLGLGASTNASALADLVQGCRPGATRCSIRSFDERDLERSDAFVEVVVE